MAEYTDTYEPEVELPLSWGELTESSPEGTEVNVSSISDGLIMSLSNFGKVDIEYIATITSDSYRTVIDVLKGSIYQNPETWNECFYLGWETAEEYLSGNLMRKWKQAKEANERYHDYFADNLRAIEKVLPKTVATKDIYITLGSPWVPADIIDDFISHILNNTKMFCQKIKNVFQIFRS